VRVFLPAAARESKHKTILFLCTGNSCRSQMAEGFARHLSSNGDEIYSAGTHPKPIHPLAIRVMQEAGIDISGQHSKGLDSIPINKIDVVVTLCGDAAANCPRLPGAAKHIHWPLSDPALAQGDEEKVVGAFRTVRDELRSRIGEWFESPS
jgi:arsenate reductase